MTERSARSGRSSLAALWATVAMFLVLLAVLALRVAGGQDPALRARAAASVAPRRILVRKVIERRVVVHLPPSAPAQPPQSSQQVSAGGAYPSSLPITRTS